MEISQDTIIAINLGALLAMIVITFGAGIQWARYQLMRKDLNAAWKAIREHEGYWKEVWKQSRYKEQKQMIKGPSVNFLLKTECFLVLNYLGGKTFRTSRVFRKELMNAFTLFPLGLTENCFWLMECQTDSALDSMLPILLATLILVTALSLMGVQPWAKKSEQSIIKRRYFFPHLRCVYLKL